MSEFEVSDIENLVKECLPKQDFEQPKTDAVNLQAMLMAMKDDRKIDTIKMHRALTGFGLKESKDAIEAAMPVKQHVENKGPQLLALMMAKIGEQLIAIEDKDHVDHFALAKFNKPDLMLIRDFIQNFSRHAN